MGYIDTPLFIAQNRFDQNQISGEPLSTPLPLAPTPPSLSLFFLPRARTRCGVSRAWGSANTFLPRLHSSLARARALSLSSSSQDHCALISPPVRDIHFARCAWLAGELLCPSNVCKATGNAGVGARFMADYGQKTRATLAAFQALKNATGGVFMPSCFEHTSDLCMSEGKPASSTPATPATSACLRVSLLENKY